MGEWLHRDWNRDFAQNLGLPLFDSLLYKVPLHFSGAELCPLLFQAKKCKFSSRGLAALYEADLGFA